VLFVFVGVDSIKEVFIVFSLLYCLMC